MRCKLETELSRYMYVFAFMASFPRKALPFKCTIGAFPLVYTNGVVAPNSRAVASLSRVVVTCFVCGKAVTILQNVVCWVCFCIFISVSRHS